MVLGLDEVREERQQLVVKADELVPANMGPRMVSASMIRFLIPAFDSRQPIAEPAGPPPTMMTSFIDRFLTLLSTSRYAFAGLLFVLQSKQASDDDALNI
jgi:hypothetical protein